MTVKTDRLVTLFGGGGFVGRYVAQALFKAGVRVRIAEREPRRAFFLQAALRPRPDPVHSRRHRPRERCRRRGRRRRRGDQPGRHPQGQFPRRPCQGRRQRRRRRRREQGARALVHLSAIGADPDSPSDYGRSKGEGEAAVRAAFPGAAIIRPSIVFGPEDNFVNRFASMARLLPVVPVIRGAWKLQPLFVADLGKAIAAAALEPAAHAGTTYELGGPQVFTMREFNEWICRAIGHESKAVVDVPDAFARLGARLFGWAPGAPITWDQWLMLQNDNVANGALPGFEAFGIRPAPLAAVAEAWLPIYRRHGRWAVRRPIDASEAGRVDSRKPFRQGSALPIWRLPTDRWPSG